MTSYTFVHEGRPKPKERPRSGKNGRIYTPKATLEAEAELAASYEGPLFEGPISIWMQFHPTSTTIQIEDWFGPISSLRGDIDNYLKLPLDALQGLAYPNDRQVMSVVAEKLN